MFFKKKKEEYIEVEYCDSLDVEEIKIKKDGIEFNITIKETKDTHYVWFVYAFIKKFNRFKLLAFSSRKFDCLKDCKEAALKYFNNLNKID